MKKVPGATKFPRAGKSFQTPVVKIKKKKSTLETSKLKSIVKLLIVLFLLAAVTRSYGQTSAKPHDSTTQTHAQDSIARLNVFVKEFGDTATIGRFQLWLFKNGATTPEQYQNFSSMLDQYYRAYIGQRYYDFLQSTKTKGTTAKPKQ